MHPSASSTSASPHEATDLLSSGLSKELIKKRESIEQEKKNFLNLYIEMLKNQDPSSPMDYSQMANMTLSFQNTSNILDIKELLYTKLQENAETKLVDMAGLVGREVIVEGNELELKTDDNKIRQAEVRYELPKKVEKATLVIKNQEGHVVSEIKGLSTNQGMNTYIWTGVEDGKDNSTPDGKDNSTPDGKYSYEIKVEGFNGEGVKAVTYCKGLATDIIRDFGGKINYQINSKVFDASKILGVSSRNVLV